MLSESLRTQFLIATILLHATQYVLFLVRPCHQGPLFSDYRCCLGTGAAGWGCFRSRRVPWPDGEPAALGPQVPWAVGAPRCDRAAAKSAMMASMWLRCDHPSSSCATSLMPDLFGWYEFICSLYQPVQVAYILLMRRSSGDSIQILFQRLQLFHGPIVTMLALVVDSIGLAVLAMVSTMNVCRNCHFSFFNNTCMMPWRIRVRRCPYSFTASAIFGGPRTWWLSLYWTLLT